MSIRDTYWFPAGSRTCAQVSTRAHPPNALDRPNRARRGQNTVRVPLHPPAPGPGLAGRPVLTGAALTGRLRVVVTIEPHGDAPQQFVFHPGWWLVGRIVQSTVGRILLISLKPG